MGTYQHRQPRVDQCGLMKSLLGHQLVAAGEQLALKVIGGHPCNIIGQQPPRPVAAIALGHHFPQLAFGALPQLGHKGRTALHILGEGVVDQVIDILEVIRGCRQRHPRFGGHRPMAHAPHAVAYDDAHGSIENQLAALLAAMPAGLATLVFDTLGKRHRNICCALRRHHRFLLN